jgi:non-specific serine/threonine protein kinase/serine/threonine-protein kinase
VSTRERWQHLDELFHAAVAVPPDERSRILATCADASLRAELEDLLAAHDRAGGFIEAPAVATPGVWPEGGTSRAGQRVGPYRIVREIGRGGMGAVYLAERADGQYQQQVALKLIKRGMDSDRVLARFRAERQILASLDHPNIARLLDGGTSDDGQPYFAMEYVEGRPIDDYADASGASIDERLALFLPVCAAVAYAHQRLVVHRDIKPLNVLVTAAGVPKLLDFGIAKVLQAGDEEETSTVTGMRLLTPEYASPEQVEGRHATTVSDVYSLGVVLYELLTGRSPYRFRSRTPLDVIAAVCTTDPERPSVAAASRDAADTARRRTGAEEWAVVTKAGSPDRLRRRLRGDLDTILLTALQKEPQRRYQSVEQFADDIRRHLAGLPVRARPDTFRYRASKFVRRNRVAVAAGALAVLALVGGTATAVWQARQARAAQARAERRFNQLRTLANTVLFDYHDAIKDLKGAMPVRERLVRDALGYLDGMASEDQNDPSLQRELAGAYRRVGDVQGGDPTGLGDTEGAIRSYGKALGILEQLFRADSTDPRTRHDLATVALSLGSLVWERGDPAAGLGYARRAQVLLLALVGASPNDTELRLQLSRAYDLLGQISLDLGDAPKALSFHRADLQQLEGVPESEGQRPAIRRAVSVAYGHLADAQREEGDLQGALESHRRSLALREGLAREYPDNADYARLVSSARYYVGLALANLGRPAEALIRFKQNIAEGSAPFSNLRAGEALMALHRPAEALPQYREALRLHEAELRADSANLYKKLAVLDDRLKVCQALAALHRPEAPAACASVAALMTATPVEPTNAFPRAMYGGTYSQLGDAYDSLAAQAALSRVRRRAYRAEALGLYRQSAAIWRDLTARKLVLPSDTARLGAAEAAAAKAQAALE